jgi:glucoamylase
LIEGAALAQKLGDSQAASWYLSQAAQIQSQLGRHWDKQRQILVPTTNWTGGIPYKESGLDASVVLGLLHGAPEPSFLPLDSAGVRSTVQRLTQTFQSIYAINNRSGLPGVAIGRYPEDLYGGTHFRHGNPWVLLTAAFANYHYRVARISEDAQTARNEIQLGDQFMERIRYHQNPDGSLAEQIDRDSGYMVSARDLTWSYVEFVEASFARKAAMGAYYQNTTQYSGARDLNPLHLIWNSF